MTMQILSIQHIGEAAPRHIIPLALGGANDDLNVQLLTPDCNQRKKAQHPVDYMQSQGFLL